MTNSSKHTGFAVAIAWPETYCKQPGSWYDPIAGALGLHKNNYYKVGHAALILIDSSNEECHYFDFGRYHAPYQHGRVRSAETDHDLIIKTKALIHENEREIINIDAILSELQRNPACHGEGVLHAGYIPVDFNLSLNTVLKMHEQSHIPYGPFKVQGSNCSRFVHTAISAGITSTRKRLSFTYCVPFTPTPMSNVRRMPVQVVIPQLSKCSPFCPLLKPSSEDLKGTLPQPKRVQNIPQDAQWLSGEGAGSWFHISFSDKFSTVDRYSVDGVLECSGEYSGNSLKVLDRTQAFSITYPSNCKMITLLQGENSITLLRHKELQ